MSNILWKQLKIELSLIKCEFNANNSQNRLFITWFYDTLITIIWTSYLNFYTHKLGMNWKVKVKV